MKKIIKEIIELSKKNEIEKIEVLIEGRLECEPYNCELLLRLAILELAPPISDYYKSIDLINKVLSIEQRNINAILLLIYVNYYYLGEIDEELIRKIKTIITDNDELNSMIKYVESWFFNGKDRKIQEMYLRESISIYNGHVWNYYYLAKLCFSRCDISEGKILIKKGLENVLKIYTTDIVTDDITNIDEFINERIKGIYLTKENYQLISSFI